MSSTLATAAPGTGDGLEGIESAETLPVTGFQLLCTEFLQLMGESPLSYLPVKFAEKLRLQLRNWVYMLRKRNVQKCLNKYLSMQVWVYISTFDNHTWLDV